MAITYGVLPIPKWYFADNTGRPLGAGKMYTYSSLDQITPKPVYQDAGGQIPYTNPVLFDENGTAGPFYGSSDSSNPSDLYYIEVYDKDNNLIFTVNNWTVSGGGGGSVINNYNLDFVNHLPNNIFFRNLGASTGTVILNKQWLAPATTTRAEFSNWYYLTNFDALDRADKISFLPFTQGVHALPADVTPESYLNYTCTAPGTSETLKAVATQVSASVTALSNQACTFTIWARCNSGANSLQINTRQFFGLGGAPSPDVVNTAVILALSNAWVKYVINFAWPSTVGKTIGSCGNDGSYINICFPIGAATNIDIIKPCLYIGNFGTDLTAPEYQTYDEIDSLISKPQTGDVRISYNTEGLSEGNRLGWLLLDDGVIGSATIVAPSSIAITRANLDTYFLYKVIWQATSANPTFAQVYDNTGAAVTRSPSPDVDFALNRSMRLPVQLGLAIAAQGKPSTLQNIGTTWAVGQAFGEETHTLSISEMPNHNHPGSTFTYPPANAAAGGTPVVGGPGGAAGFNVNVAPQGGGTGHNTIQPTQRYFVYMKL